MNLLEFFNADIKNSYVTEGTYEIYVRKSTIIVDHDFKFCFQIANITNRKNSNNFKYRKYYKSKNNFSTLMNKIEELAKEYKFDGIYCESVYNEIMPDVLKRYGYAQVNQKYETINFFKSF